VKFTETDIMEMTRRAVERILSENVQNELESWHGSAADFDKFDLSFIGTGEGTQAYGYGVYVTGVEDTGRMYAVVAAYNGNVKTNKSAESLKQYKRFVSALKSVLKEIRKKIGNNPSEFIPFAIDKISKVKGVTPEMIDMVRSADSIWKMRQLFIRFQTMATRSFSRFLYRLEIPDEGYIDWNSTDTNLISRIYEEFKKNFDVRHVNLKKVQTFGDLYSQLRGWSKLSHEAKRTVIPQKQISLFLSKLGYTGIRVPIGNMHGGDNIGNNYVIFDANDIKIENKERF
jgi:hypothetical protein